MSAQNAWWDFFNTFNNAPADLLPMNVNRAVLGKLFAHADSPDKPVPLGNSRPGTPRIARDLGIGESSVWRALAWLKDAGWVVQTSQGGRKGGRKSASVYAVQVPAAVRAEMARRARMDEAEVDPSQFRELTPLNPESDPSQDWDPTVPVPTHVTGSESFAVGSAIQPPESFAVEAALPPEPAPVKSKPEGPVEQWGRFKRHADYAAILGAYTDTAHWKSQRRWGEAWDAEALFWGHLYEVTDLEDIGFPVDEWSVRSGVATRFDVGAQVGKILSAAADLKGAPLSWTPHGRLLNPNPLPRLAAA